MVIVICAITLAAGALMLWIANKSKSTSLSRSVSREIGADVETFLRNETFRMKVSRDAYKQYFNKRMRGNTLLWAVIIGLVFILGLIDLIIKSKSGETSSLLFAIICVSIPVGFLLVKDAISMKPDTNTDAYIIEAFVFNKSYASITETNIRMAYYDFVGDKIRTTTAVLDNLRAKKIEAGNCLSILTIQRKQALEFISIVDMKFSDMARNKPQEDKHNG
jgi:hypothetical protein